MRALVFLMVALSGAAFAGDVDQGRGTDPKLERATFQLINEFRASEHLSLLVWSNEAAAAARAHSKNMALGAVDFGHAGFSDRVRLLRSEIPGVTGCGENVLLTSNPVAAEHQAVDNWLKSAPHRHNILADFNASGIGVWVGAEGTIYFTQIFVKIARTSDPDDPAN